VRIVISGLNYAPELTGIGYYTGDMAAWLDGRGHAVRVVTAYPYYPEWRVAAGYRPWRYSTEVHAGVPVHRCPIWVPTSHGTAKRLLHLAVFAATSLPVVVWRGLRHRPDVVWTTEPSIFGAPAVLLAAKLAGARSWLHVQDIEVGAAVRLGMIRNRLLQRVILGCYRFLLRRFDVVSTISHTMADELKSLGGPDDIVLFPNWVDVDRIHPGADTGELRAELGVPEDATVALYSGNMGEKQGIDTLLEAARRLADRRDIHFLLCGAGAARARLEEEAAALPNVHLRPLQPTARLNELLNLADIHLLPQRRGTTLFAMPSKLGGMLASGRAIVAQVDDDSELATLVGDCALVVPPEDAAATAAAVRRLADDPDLRAALGHHGRRLATERLSRDAVLDAFVATATTRLRAGARRDRRRFAAGADFTPSRVCPPRSKEVHDEQ
jgi:colanic acid biosynthesis glycosyl transferase WcaI